MLSPIDAYVASAQHGDTSLRRWGSKLFGRPVASVPPRACYAKSLPPAPRMERALRSYVFVLDEASPHRVGTPEGTPRMIGPGGNWIVKKGRESMNEETFQRKLAELIAEIGTLPTGERDKLELLAEQTRVRHRQLKETVNSLQESIDFVRLSIKYMLFDLEATRRENDQLRKLLEENNNNDNGL